MILQNRPVLSSLRGRPVTAVYKPDIGVNYDLMYEEYIALFKLFVVLCVKLLARSSPNGTVAQVASVAKK